MYRVSRDFNAESSTAAKKIFTVLKPELNRVKEHRSKTKIKVKGKVISINVEARDKVALKATLNSYSRLINLCLGLINLY